MNRNALLPFVTSAEQKEIKRGKKTLSTLEVDKRNKEGQEKNISTTTIWRRCTPCGGVKFYPLTSPAYLWKKKTFGKDLVGHEVKNHHAPPQTTR
jgi:hypothetical protein